MKFLNLTLSLFLIVFLCKSICFAQITSTSRSNTTVQTSGTIRVNATTVLSTARPTNFTSLPSSNRTTQFTTVRLNSTAQSTIRVNGSTIYTTVRVNSTTVYPANYSTVKVNSSSPVYTTIRVNGSTPYSYNSTYNQHNTTWYPYYNSTNNQHNTTWYPYYNTTWYPYYNTTWYPYYNSTNNQHNTTWYPYYNTTWYPPTVPSSNSTHSNDSQFVNPIEILLQLQHFFLHNGGSGSWSLEDFQSNGFNMSHFSSALKNYTLMHSISLVFIRNGLSAFIMFTPNNTLTVNITSLLNNLSELKNAINVLIKNGYMHHLIPPKKPQECKREPTEDDEDENDRPESWNQGENYNGNGNVVIIINQGDKRQRQQGNRGNRKPQPFMNQNHPQPVYQSNHGNNMGNALDNWFKKINHPNRIQ